MDDEFWTELYEQTKANVPETLVIPADVAAIMAMFFEDEQEPQKE